MVNEKLPVLKYIKRRFCEREIKQTAEFDYEWKCHVHWAENSIVPLVIDHHWWGYLKGWKTIFELPGWLVKIQTYNCVECNDLPSAVEIAATIFEFFFVGILTLSTLGHSIKLGVATSRNIEEHEKMTDNKDDPMQVKFEPLLFGYFGFVLLRTLLHLVITQRG